MSSNWRLPTATGVYFSIFDRPTRKSIFLQPRVLERVSWSYQQSKEFFSEAWVFFQARTIWEALLWERRAIYSECRVKSEMANYVNFARRMRLAALYFQLGDHIPTSATMASYQTSIISLGVQPSTNGREPDDFHLLAMTQELSIDLPLSNRVANQISNIIRKKSDEKTILSLRFVPSLQSAVCSMHFVLTGSWVELSSFESVR